MAVFYDLETPEFCKTCCDMQLRTTVISLWSISKDKIDFLESREIWIAFQIWPAYDLVMSKWKRLSLAILLAEGGYS